MGSDLSPEDKKFFEDFIKKYEPYPDDAPEVNFLDYPSDPRRGAASLMKLILEGKLK